MPEWNSPEVIMFGGAVIMLIILASSYFICQYFLRESLCKCPKGYQPYAKACRKLINPVKVRQLPHGWKFDALHNIWYRCPSGYYRTLSYHPRTADGCGKSIAGPFTRAKVSGSMCMKKAWDAKHDPIDEVIHHPFKGQCYGCKKGYKMGFGGDVCIKPGDSKPCK